MQELEKNSKLKKEDDDREFIFRPWITVNGHKIYAKSYGIKAFKICID